MNYNKTCVNRFLGRCPHCDVDYSDKYPNNTHCFAYQEMSLGHFVVKETVEREQTRGSKPDSGTNH